MVTLVGNVICPNVEEESKRHILNESEDTRHVADHQSQKCRNFTHHSIEELRNCTFESKDESGNHTHNQTEQSTEEFGNNTHHSIENHTLYAVEDRKFSCSMIQNMTFMFTLGRKMPLYVDIICIVIGIIGLIGNVGTVVTVVINFKARKSYFTALLTLAVADFLCIVARIGIMFLEFEVPMYVQCIKPSYYVLMSVLISIEINSILQIILIAVIKFLLLVFPIKSKLYITNKIIAGVFFGIWLVSAGSAFLSCYFIMKKVEANENASNIAIVSIAMVIIPSILVIVLLHIIKLVILRDSQALKKEFLKINKVFSVVLAIYVVHNVQLLITNVIFKLTQDIGIAQIFQGSINISSFVHRASNPFIYVVFTPLVQEPWRKLKERFGKGPIASD
jgi:hypothetical protein